MKIIAKKSQGGGLKAGTYVGKVASIEEVEAPAKEGYIDPTPQFKVILETEEGQKQHHWMNTVGFTRYPDLTDKQKKSGNFLSAGDEGYAVDKKTKKRVISDKATEDCQNMLNNFAYACGAEEDSEVDLMDLVDSEIAFEVEIKNKYSRVKQFMLPSEANA